MMDKVLLFLAILVCPITMGTMMFFMMRKSKKGDNASKDSDKIYGERILTSKWTMTMDNHTMSQEEFDSIYSKVPRLTVEIILKNEKDAIYLTKRAIQPCKGQWHLPGGTVRFGELTIDAVKRIARRELDIEVGNAKNVGYVDYPSHYQNGLDSPVGIVFEVTEYAGALHTNGESENSGWFEKLPENMHADQDVFLLNNGYLRQ